MTRSTLSLLTLACVSAASLTFSISRDQAESLEPEVAPKVRAAFDAAIQDQALGHLNPPVRIHDRMSRVLRPLPRSLYTTRIVATTRDGVLFELVHTDRSKLDTPVTKTVTTGKFTVKDNVIQLWDDKKDAFVPASLHPLVFAKIAVY